MGGLSTTLLVVITGTALGGFVVVVLVGLFLLNELRELRACTNRLYRRVTEVAMYVGYHPPDSDLGPECEATPPTSDGRRAGGYDKVYG